MTTRTLYVGIIDTLDRFGPLYHNTLVSIVRDDYKISESAAMYAIADLVNAGRIRIVRGMYESR